MKVKTPEQEIIKKEKPEKLTPGGRTKRGRMETVKTKGNLSAARRIAGKHPAIELLTNAVGEELHPTGWGPSTAR